MNRVFGSGNTKKYEVDSFYSGEEARNGYQRQNSCDENEFDNRDVTSRKSKNGRVWSIGGFNNKTVTVILWIISVIPCVPMSAGVVNMFRYSEALRNFSDGYMYLFHSIWGLVTVTWIMPFALFIANRGLKVMYRLYKAIFKLPKYIKEMTIILVSTLLCMIVFFSGECIITAFYILVRLIRRDFE